MSRPRANKGHLLYTNENVLPDTFYFDTETGPSGDELEALRFEHDVQCEPCYFRFNVLDVLLPDDTKHSIYRQAYLRGYCKNRSQQHVYVILRFKPIHCDNYPDLIKMGGKVLFLQNLQVVKRPENLPSAGNVPLWPYAFFLSAKYKSLVTEAKQLKFPQPLPDYRPNHPRSWLNISSQENVEFSKLRRERLAPSDEGFSHQRIIYLSNHQQIQDFAISKSPISSVAKNLLTPSRKRKLTEQRFFRNVRTRLFCDEEGEGNDNNEEHGGDDDDEEEKEEIKTDKYYLEYYKRICELIRVSRCQLNPNLPIIHENEDDSDYDLIDRNPVDENRNKKTYYKTSADKPVDMRNALKRMTDKQKKLLGIPQIPNLKTFYSLLNNLPRPEHSDSDLNKETPILAKTIRTVWTDNLPPSTALNISTIITDQELEKAMLKFNAINGNHIDYTKYKNSTCLNNLAELEKVDELHPVNLVGVAVSGIEDWKLTLRDETRTDTQINLIDLSLEFKRNLKSISKDIYKRYIANAKLYPELVEQFPLIQEGDVISLGNVMRIDEEFYCFQPIDMNVMHLYGLEDRITVARSISPATLRRVLMLAMMNIRWMLVPDHGQIIGLVVGTVFDDQTDEGGVLILTPRPMTRKSFICFGDEPLLSAMVHNIKRRLAESPSTQTHKFFKKITKVDVIRQLVVDGYVTRVNGSHLDNINIGEVLYLPSMHPAINLMCPGFWVYSQRAKVEPFGKLSCAGEWTLRAIGQALQSYRPLNRIETHMFRLIDTADVAKASRKVCLLGQLKLFAESINRINVKLVRIAYSQDHIVDDEDMQPVSAAFKHTSWLRYASRMMRRLMTGVLGWRGAQLYSDIHLVDGPIRTVEAFEQVNCHAEEDDADLWRVKARVANFHCATASGQPIETISDIKQNLYWWWCPNCYATEPFMDLFFEFRLLWAKDKTREEMPCAECKQGKMEPRLAVKLELIDQRGDIMPVVLASPLLESLTLMSTRLWQLGGGQMSSLSNIIFGPMSLNMLVNSLCPDRNDPSQCPQFTWVLDTSPVHTNRMQSIFGLWQVQSFYFDFQHRST